MFLLHRNIFKFVLALIVFLSASVILLYNLDPNPAYQGNHQNTSGPTLTIFLIDGLSKKVFDHELDNGKLPFIQKIMEEAIYVENGIGSFPTMTGYAFYPFLTGEDAVNSGIYGLRWIDRKRTEGEFRNYVGRTNIHMNMDINREPKNLFEKYNSMYTASINTYMNRGVHHSIITGWAHTTAKYQNSLIPSLLRSIPFVGEDISKNHFQHETLVTDLAMEQLKMNPKVHWITYPSLDAQHHVHGMDSTYVHLLRHIDAEIGRYQDKMIELGQPNRMIAIVSDHGVSEVNKNMAIDEMLEESLGIKLERGKSIHLLSSKLSDDLLSLDGVDGFFVINGNLSAYLYLKDEGAQTSDQWKVKQEGENLTSFQSKIDLPKFLSGLSAVDLVAYADGNKVHLNKNGKKAWIIKQGENYGYHYELEDPLAYKNDIKQDSFYSKAEWLALTIESAYPLAIPRLYDLMSKEDGPDIVISAAPGYDFAPDYEIFVKSYKGGHGSIRNEVLNVPYILYKKGMVPEKINAMTSEDFGKLLQQKLN